MISSVKVLMLVFLDMNLHCCSKAVCMSITMQAVCFYCFDDKLNGNGSLLVMQNVAGDAKCDG